MDTVDGIPKYWVGRTWVPGKDPVDDYNLYRVHEVIESDGSLGDYITRVYFTQIGIIHHFYDEESFSPQKRPWIDHCPVSWFVDHYTRYGENKSEQSVIALAELASC